MYHIDFWRSLWGVLAPVLWVGIQPSIMKINVPYAGAKSCPEAWSTHFFVSLKLVIIPIILISIVSTILAAMVIFSMV
jgi:hypothetical protein